VASDFLVHSRWASGFAQLHDRVALREGVFESKMEGPAG